MPWSPVPRIPAIMELIKNRGYTKQVNLEMLRKAIIECLGMTSEVAIRRTISIMEELDFLKQDPAVVGVWSVNHQRPPLKYIGKL
jgi:hypothetical protein